MKNKHKVLNKIHQAFLKKVGLFYFIYISCYVSLQVIIVMLYKRFYIYLHLLKFYHYFNTFGSFIEIYT